MSPILVFIFKLLFLSPVIVSLFILLLGSNLENNEPMWQYANLEIIELSRSRA